MTDALVFTLAQGGWILWLLLALAVLIYSSAISIWIDCHSIQRGSQNPTQVSASQDMEKIQRRLPFLAVLIATAPLLGLLGTVSGMLTTFQGINQPGAATPLDTVSAGISEALVTTQAGLVIAVPASFLLVFLRTRATAVSISASSHA